MKEYRLLLSLFGMRETPSYLVPYESAAREHGGGFRTLLWASPKTQRLRFDAITRLVNFTGKTVLDVGCGRADFLDHLQSIGDVPEEYMGIEAVDSLAEIALKKKCTRVQIARCDFVRDPVRMYTGSDVIVLCGSLNTLNEYQFHQTLRHAWKATADCLVFNFLCSPSLAAAAFLKWHRLDDVLKVVREMTPHVKVLEDYLHGDATIAMWKVKS